MPAPASSVRGKIALIVFGLVYSAACFIFGCYAGRQFYSRIVPPVAGNSAPAATATNATPLNAAVDPAREVPARQTGIARPATGWDDNEWLQIISRPANPARNDALAALLEKLAAVDPDRAMSLARAESNLKLRQLLVQSALHGWARTSPTNAANWALARTDANERERALSTVFAGAVAADPESAMRFGESLIQEHPDDATSYGASLIEALGAAGNFETAARLAADGDSSTRAGWMGSAYSQWAELQPEQAAAAAAAIKDPALRNEALHGIVGGWAEADPAALIQFVTALPADSEHGPLLSQALERWAKEDPEAASAWINQNESGPDLDVGVAAVATMDSIKPDLAVGWAESVTDPKLRSETLVTVIRNWLTTDLPAARQYFDSTKNLSPEDRQELAEVFTNFYHGTAGR
jgi:hypothetical protein